MRVTLRAHCKPHETAKVRESCTYAVSRDLESCRINDGMKLTDEDVAEFRRVYKEAYGEEMPPEEARMWAIRLVRLYRILLLPTPSEIAGRLAKSDERATLEAPPAAPVECQKSTQTST